MNGYVSPKKVAFVKSDNIFNVPNSNSNLYYQNFDNLKGNYIQQKYGSEAYDLKRPVNVVFQPQTFVSTSFSPNLNSNMQVQKSNEFEVSKFLMDQNEELLKLIREKETDNKVLREKYDKLSQSSLETLNDAQNRILNVMEEVVKENEDLGEIIANHQKQINDLSGKLELISEKLESGSRWKFTLEKLKEENHLLESSQVECDRQIEILLKEIARLTKLNNEANDSTNLKSLETSLKQRSGEICSLEQEINALKMEIQQYNYQIFNLNKFSKSIPLHIIQENQTLGIELSKLNNMILHKEEIIKKIEEQKAAQKKNEVFNSEEESS